MINEKRVLAITPARGGSKGLPGKNIKSFCGKPLLYYPIQTALKSQYIDEIIVSTDCSDIARTAEECGAKVHHRSAKLATDEALVADTIRDLIGGLDEEYDYVVLLEATSPLRTTDLVDQCIETILENDADSVATFSLADPPPTRLWRLENGRAHTYIDNADPARPRQQQDEAYFLNGLAYVFKVKSFLQSNTNIIFFGNKLAVVTDLISVDIDTEEDFKLAEYLMEYNHD